MLDLFCKYTKWYFIYHYGGTRQPKLGGFRKTVGMGSALGTVVFVCAWVFVCVFGYEGTDVNV